MRYPSPPGRERCPRRRRHTGRVPPGSRQPPGQFSALPPCPGHRTNVMLAGGRTPGVVTGATVLPRAVSPRRARPRRRALWGQPRSAGLL